MIADGQLSIADDGFGDLRLPIVYRLLPIVYWLLPIVYTHSSSTFSPRAVRASALLYNG